MDLTLSKGEKKLRLLAVHLKSGCFDKSLESKDINSMEYESKSESREKLACYILSNQIKPLESWIDKRAEDLWTATMTKISECWGGYHKEYIDHIILDPKARERYVKNSFNQLVFDQEYSRELSQNLSDHCPISIKIEM